MCKQDLALNNLQGLICSKLKPTNQPTNQPDFIGHIDFEKDWGG